MLLTALIAAAILVCGLQALRSGRLLTSALWLAGASAAVAVLMYQLGAPEVAVIELSVGAGLVTVLFVFAINIAGEDPSLRGPAIPRGVAWAFVLVAVVLVGRFVLAALPAPPASPDTTGVATVLWQQRTLDALLQIVLIFSGVLAVLGLLHEPETSGAGTEGS